MTRLRLISFVAILSALCAGSARADYPARNLHAEFDGMSYISVPQTAALNGTLSAASAMSIDAWVYPTSYANYPTIVGNDYTAGYWLGFNTAGKLRFYPGGGSFWESAGSVPLNQWTHVAVSYEVGKGNLTFYINNAVDVQHSGVHVTIGTQTGDLRIGADQQGGSPAYQFAGKLDEVRIWRTVVGFPSTSGELYTIPQDYAAGLYGSFLVASWRLNGDAADSAGGNHGSIVGSVAFTAKNNPPLLSRICAVLMNDVAGVNDHVLVPHAASLSMTDTYTLECWVYLLPGGASSTYQTFLAKGSMSASQYNYWLGVNKANGKLRFAPTGDFTAAMESTGALPTGQWVHVAARYSHAGGNGSATLFVNGVQAGTASYSTAAVPNTLPLLVGSSDQVLSPPSNNLYGRIDEVRIWNIARSDDAIRNGYRCEYSGAWPGLVASYHFDGDVLDASDAVNHGANTNSASNAMYFQSASDLPATPTLAVVAPNGGENWPIGSAQNVTWTAAGLAAVDIELSRDGGATWTETLGSSIDAGAGSSGWTVTGPETAQARVRVVPSTPAPVEDAGDGDFAVTALPMPHIVALPSSITRITLPGVDPPAATLKVNNGGSGTLAWTAAGTVPWLGVTPSSGVQGDSIAVSVAVAGLAAGTHVGGVRISGNADNSPLLVTVQVTISTSAYYPVSGAVRFGGTGIADIPVRVTGDTTLELLTAGDGSFAIAGLRAGSYAVAAVSPFYTFTPASYALTNISTPRNDLVFTGTPRAGSANLHYAAGWNLVSLPVDPAVHDIAALLPDAEAPRRAFRYSPDSGYIAETQLQFGVGYWIKFTKSDSATIAGNLRGDLTLALTARGGGWNLVGCGSGSVGILSATQSPPGSLITAYQFDAGAGYRLPPGDLFRPGRAYFVKVSRDMTLSLHSSFAPEPGGNEPGGNEPGGWNAHAPSRLPDILARPPGFPAR